MQHVDNILLVEFNQEQNTLTFFDLRADGTKSPYTQVKLEQLISSGKDIACREVGKMVLVRLKNTREALF